MVNSKTTKALGLLATAAARARADVIFNQGSQYQDSKTVDIPGIAIGGDLIFNSVTVHASGRISFGSNGNSINFRGLDFGEVSVGDFPEPDSLKISHDHVDFDDMKDYEKVDQSTQAERFTFSYNDGVRDTDYTLTISSDDSGENVYIVREIIAENSGFNVPTQETVTVEKDNEEVCVSDAQSVFKVSDYIKCDISFLECDGDPVPSDGNMANVFVSSPDDFGKIMGILTCSEGEKLYPVGNPTLGEDLPDFAIYDCKYEADYYKNIWAPVDTEYECRPEVGFSFCPAGTYDCGHGDCYTDGFEVECRCHPGFESSEDVRACNFNFDECASDATNQCQNGSACIDLDPELTGFGYTCICQAEYDYEEGFDDELILGGTCSVKLDDCVNSPCTKSGDANADCTDGVRIIPGLPQYTCTCSEGFIEDNGTCVKENPCNQDPCQNGGRCNWDGSNDYECTCRSRFEGKDCEIEKSICETANPCQNGAACSDDENQGYKCACPDGFKGKTCGREIQTISIKNVLLSHRNSCEGGDGSEATEDDQNVFKNVFLPKLEQFWARKGAIRTDYLGTICATIPGKGGKHGRFAVQIPVSSSNRKKRQAGDDLDFDDLMSDFADEFADELAAEGIASDDINTGDDINDINDSLPADEQIADEVVVEQNVCADTVIPGNCLNDATCVDVINSSTGISETTCECAPGFEGEFCQNAIDFCATADCQNGALCQNNVDGFYCDCLADFDGVQCETDTFCAASPCENGMPCSNAQCDCGATDEFISSGDLCEVRDYCSVNDPCQNGSDCQNAVNGAVCICSDGFLGANCEIAVADLCNALNCGAFGQCVIDDSNTAAFCNCDYGYSGANCENRNACTLDRPCNSLNSVDGGCSLSNTGEVECACKDGYEGQFCDIDPCNIVSSFNTCDATWSDIDSCLVHSDVSLGTVEGKCACNGDSENRMDLNCAEWGPICAEACSDGVRCDVVDGAAVCDEVIDPVTPTDPDTPVTPVDPTNPSMCPAWPEGESVTKHVTMRYINELKTTLANDISATGDCYKVIKTRIYGSMQLSADLISYGGQWLQKFSNIEADQMERSNYATQIKALFFEAFAECEEASCVMDEFCHGLVRLTDGNDSLYEQLNRRCHDEAWRFQAFINDGSTEHCKFSIVPMNSQTCPVV